MEATNEEAVACSDPCLDCIVASVGDAMHLLVFHGFRMDVLVRKLRVHRNVDILRLPGEILRLELEVLRSRTRRQLHVLLARVM